MKRPSLSTGYLYNGDDYNSTKKDCLDIFIFPALLNYSQYLLFFRNKVTTSPFL
ncbi:hypothetical protein PLEI_0362 [Photobacterium leiognathi lrivu.4.1]|uniref:Uncharacterized protein n=1 Tax=Photobacterium leiognathi lrivu.4.1 TaxID=1248232 RepID=V5F1T3_PHOLE|nr:hypothetical protein PLEI_0362 [Photobacterium leiognathi lrivu.4.1]